MSPADLKQFIAERRGRANELVATSEWDAAVVAYSEAIDASWKLLKQLPDGQTAEVLSKQSRQATFLGSINALWANSSLVGSRQPRTSISSTGQLSSELPLPADEKTKDLSILFSNRSAAFLSLRKYPESINDARMAIGLRPGWPKPYFRLGEALSAMTCYDEALAAYSRALEKSLESDQSSFANTIQERLKRIAYLHHDQSRRIRIQQWQAGKDFAVQSLSPVKSFVFGFAKNMMNYVYSIGCEETKECFLVDVCWDLDGILSLVRESGFRVTGAIVTHGHFDHCGGRPPKPFDNYRVKVDGLYRLLKRCPQIKAYIHSADVYHVMEHNPKLPLERVEPTYDGYRIRIGRSVEIRCMHTPGHTPGSQCILINENRLLSGDTMFIGNIGRLDMAGADIPQAFESIKKLCQLNESIVVYPGHNYGGSYTTIKQEKTSNPMLQAPNLEEFQQLVAMSNPKKP